MRKMKERDTAIDLCKGLAILLMVVGHVLPQYNGFCVWIFTFHMPLFFFLAGMTFKPKPFLVQVSGSAKRLLLPFLTCMVCSILIHLLFGNSEWVRLRFEGLFFPDPFRYPILGFYPRGTASALWFLMALFWGRIYLNGLYSGWQKAYLPVSLCITLMCGYIGKYCFNLPLGMLIGGCAVGYMAMGKWYSEHIDRVDKVPQWVWLVFIPLWLFVARRYYFQMWNFDYQKRAYIISVAVACMASMFIYRGAHQISQKTNPRWYRWLQWCGENSFTILLGHFFAAEIMYIMIGVFEHTFTRAEIVVWWVGGTAVWALLLLIGKRCIRMCDLNKSRVRTAKTS